MKKTELPGMIKYGSIKEALNAINQDCTKHHKAYMEGLAKNLKESTNAGTTSQKVSPFPKR